MCLRGRGDGHQPDQVLFFFFFLSFFNNCEVIWVICTSICHLASRPDHPYGVRTINLEEFGPLGQSAPWNLPADLTVSHSLYITSD